MTAKRPTEKPGSKSRWQLESNPRWYKDAVIYEVHVRAFFDSADDGVGDFRGLARKLDYLQDLGITAIWVLPFYPSPLRDDGYDIADYVDVNRTYGVLRDVEVLLGEAHRRGIRVITELVLNHTSDQHAWFQRARRAKPGSAWRDFYVWSDDPKRYAEARIIFKDFEASNWTWDPVAKAYYWHRFYSHQPDLNFDNPAVQRAMLQVVDFWFRMGVDGLRLDAVPYLYEREGTNCENLQETHGFLRALRRHVDEHFEDRMLLAEANQWPEDAVAYFGEGDECHMAFHFPVMPRLFMATHMEDRFPIVDILSQTPAIPDSCQWALFLRNHDELTLEMVTDEERDYMYRVFAHDPQARINLGIRRRLAPLLGNHRRRIELLNGLLLSLPGTPVIYYGDEIGMGDNIYLGDRNGVRTPMQWSNDRNAGFSRASPQRLYLPVVVEAEYHPEAVSVEQQQRNPHSLLWWMKRLIALRKRFKAFGRGTLEMLHADNRKVLAFTRSFEEERILVVANLSRFVQCVELDLAAFRGHVPIELFGNSEFPPIREHPYFLTLAPHTFLWFALEPPPVPAAEARPQAEEPLLTVQGDWERACEPGPRAAALEGILARYIVGCRWFGGKARRILAVAIVETIPVANSTPEVQLVILRVGYAEGEPETYVLPLAAAAGDAVRAVRERVPHGIVARLARRGSTDEGVLYEAVWDKGFSAMLLDAIVRRRRFRSAAGELVATSTRALRALQGEGNDGLEPSVLKGEQSNTSILYGSRFILKLFRRVEAGTNPDLEIGRFLTERAGFVHVPPVAGALTYESARAEPLTMGILQGFVPNEGDAWSYTLDVLGRYFEQVVARREQPAVPSQPLVALLDEPTPQLVGETIGSYLEAARLLGQRTAELHLALASAADEPDFAPEPFGTLYQRSLYQSMRNLARQVFEVLRKQRRVLPEAIRPAAEQLLGLEGEVDLRLRSVLQRRLSSLRIRCHGDYHLGQVLYTGKDFVIIDFEGEPARSLTERRLKRSPLRDVAGMLRSYHYAAYTAFTELGRRGLAPGGDRALVEPWARFWYAHVSVAFLRAYLAAAATAEFLPRQRPEVQLLLDVYLLDKALYELRYELNSRPEWVSLPLQGILQLLATPLAQL